MDIFEIFQTAFESIKRNKLRSILTSLGIIIGISSIIMLISIGSGLQSFVSSQFEKLGANTIFIVPGKIEFGAAGGPPRSVNKLTFSLVDSLAKNKGAYITKVTPIIEISATVASPTKSKIATLAGTESDYLLDFDIKAATGRLYTASDEKAARKVTIMGSTLAKDLFKNQNPLGKSVTISGKKFTIIGVLEPRGNVGGIDTDNFVAVPLLTARRLTGADQVNSILIRTTSTNTVEQAKKTGGKDIKKNPFRR